MHSGWKDRSGGLLASGVYLVRVRTGHDGDDIVRLMNSEVVSGRLPTSLGTSRELNLEEGTGSSFGMRAPHPDPGEVIRDPDARERGVAQLGPELLHRFRIGSTPHQLLRVLRLLHAEIVTSDRRSEERHPDESSSAISPWPSPGQRPDLLHELDSVRPALDHIGTRKRDRAAVGESLWNVRRQRQWEQSGPKLRESSSVQGRQDRSSGVIRRPRLIRCRLLSVCSFNRSRAVRISRTRPK